MKETTRLPSQGDVIAAPFGEDLAAVWRVKLIRVHGVLGVAVADVEHILDAGQVRQVVYPLQR